MRQGPLALLLQPFQNLPKPPPKSFNGKTGLITGGNQGLGFEVARHMIQAGATRIVLAVRDMTKGEAAAKSLAAPDGVEVEVWELEMSSFASVKGFAAKVNASPISFDYVFLNAGMATHTYNKSPEGWEMMLQVNVLSTALLGLLLLPKLSEGQKDSVPRMVITTSGLHAVPHFTEWKSENVLEMLNDQSHFESKANMTENYMISKLLDVYITRELAKMVPTADDGTPKVIVNTAAPGLCRTQLQREGPGFPLTLILRLLGRSAEMGSRVLLRAALLGTESNGCYIENDAITESGGMSIGPDGQKAQEKVWKEILAVLKPVVPDATW